MLKIFNTITKKKENFIFPDDKNIKIYVCGITPYSYCHIGHARTFLIFDIIIRYFIYLGYKITYVRNITDIDDKIINESNLRNIKYNELTNKFILEYSNSFKKLNIIEPNYEPKVTNYINEIINTINILIKKNHAYINNNGDVLFKINSYKSYGLISNKKYIKFNSDFVLWKKINNKENKPIWKSPWGLGRPGWHIECSTISNIFFKNNIDIHGGGIDLIFPHHENEYAQSYCAYNNFKINRWVHIGTVNFLSKKVSKSSNNIELRKILNKFNPDTIRFFLTNKYYRKPLEYNINNLIKSSKSIKKLYSTLSFFKLDLIDCKNYYKTKFTQDFLKSINDDFNIAKIYSILFKMSNEINKNKKNRYLYSLNIAKEMKFLSSIIGILQNDEENNTKKNISNKISNEKINILIKKRNIYRKNKNWKIADKIRLFLYKNNIIIEDNYEKTIWKYK